MVTLLVRSTLVITLLVAGCSDGPDQLSFSRGDGTGKDLGTCDCEYDDGSHGSPFIQVSCNSGSKIGDVSFFLDPTVTMADQGILLIFLPSDVPASYRGSGTGQYGSLGPERRANASKIVRSIDGIEVRWDEQDACDAANGCNATKYHLAAGAAHGGSGGCDDFWASVDQ
jgi:hypothetical protein